MLRVSVSVGAGGGTRLVVFSVLVEELFAEGVFDGGGVVGFAEDAEVGLVGGEGEGCAGVGADALGAAHCGLGVGGRGGCRWHADGRAGEASTRTGSGTATRRSGVVLSPLDYCTRGCHR